MQKTTFGLLIGSALLFAGVASAQTTATASATTISYPIAELGSCTSKTDCKKYCDQTQNIRACVQYATSKNLIQHLEAQKMLILQTLTGPNGCNGLQCIAYCNELSHLTECAALAEKVDSIYVKARAATTATQQNVHANPGPGGCTTFSQCASYCRKNPLECKNIAAQKVSNSTPTVQHMPVTNTLFPVAPTVVPHNNVKQTSSQLLGAAAITAILWFFHI